MEGVEGSGKTSQAAALSEYLEGRGVPVAVTREPGGTELGEKVRRILLDPGCAGMVPLAELFLYLASRAEHVSRVVKPLLEKGVVVISDRFADASVAYQGGGRKLGADLVCSMNDVATEGVKPDITFLFDFDPEEGLDRLILSNESGVKGTGQDRIESEALDFHRRVRAAYLAAAEREPARFIVVDARRTREELASQVVGRVDELLESRRDPEEAGPEGS